jgi:hypothetical protein
MKAFWCAGKVERRSGIVETTPQLSFSWMNKIQYNGVGEIRGTDFTSILLYTHDNGGQTGISCKLFVISREIGMCFCLIWL